MTEPETVEAVETVEAAAKIRAESQGAGGSETMRIWKEIWQTDPAYTRRVNSRGGFTAIDAYYKILKATRQFGPAGEGWGWEELRAPEIVNGVFMVAIRLWYVERGERRQGFPIYGTAQWERNGKFDVDAPKKALTDAITKGLSYLGACADVFLGKFDDSKYVEARAKQERQRAQGVARG